MNGLHNMPVTTISPNYYWAGKDRASLVAERLKRLPPMRETRARSLGWEDPDLEKEMAIHSSILAWRIPWTEKPSRLQSTGSQRVGHDWATLPYLTLPYLKQRQRLGDIDGRWLLHLCLKKCFNKRVEDLMLSNCGVGEDSWESPGQQGDPTTQS